MENEESISAISGAKSLYRKYVVLTVATFAFVVLGVELLSYPTISTVVASEFHLSNTESGLVTSAFSLTYALMQIPAGILADRFGGGRLLPVSLVVATIAPILFVTGGSFSTALASRAIAGIGCGAILPSSIRLLSSWFEEKELSRAMGIFGSGFGVSFVLAYILLPLLTASGNWRPSLIWTIVFSLVVTGMAILPLRWKAEKGLKNPPMESVKVDIRGLLTRNLFALTLPNFTALAMLVGVLTWAPAFLSQRLGLSNVQAGQIVSLIGIMSILASYGGGYLSRKFGNRKTIVISMMLAVLFPILLATTNSEVSAILWICGVGWAGMLYFAPSFALIPYAAKQGPRVAGIEFGVFNSLSNIGSFVSPILLGFVLDSTGSFSLSFMVLGVIAISGVVGGVLLKE